MYIKNDICYAGKMEDGIRVIDAKPLRGRMLLVTFSTGEKRLFDTTKLEGSAFQPLENEAVFQNIVLFHGVITWNNGEIDIAPETVYQESYAYECDAVPSMRQSISGKPRKNMRKFGSWTKPNSNMAWAIIRQSSSAIMRNSWSMHKSWRNTSKRSTSVEKGGTATQKQTIPQLLCGLKPTTWGMINCFPRIMSRSALPTNISL